MRCFDVDACVASFVDVVIVNVCVASFVDGITTSVKEIIQSMHRLIHMHVNMHIHAHRHFNSCARTHAERGSGTNSAGADTTGVGL